MASTATRNYGEPTDRGYEKAMDALTDAVAYYRGADYRDWRIGALEVMEDIGQEAALTFAIDGPVDNASYVKILDSLRDAAPSAEPCYVEDDVLAVIQAASAELSTIDLRPTDIPWEKGFVYLPRPLAGRIPEGDLVAFSWTVTDLRSAPHLITMAYTYERDRIVCARPGFFPLAGTPPELWGESDGGAVGSVMLMVAFFLLVRQRLFVTSRERPSRAVRRRARRAIQTVRVIRLRVTDYSGLGGSRRTDWSHRWLVSGHWRNQWLPSEQRHRPVWVSPYVKGPSDKPFVAKRRAFEFMK